MKKMFTAADVIIILIVLAVSLGGYVCAAFFDPTDTKTAVIEVDGEIYASYVMSGIKTPITVDIDGHSTAEIGADYVRMTDATCPDGLCVSQGKITRAGQIIICIPNKTTARITGKSETDAISR